MFTNSGPGNFQVGTFGSLAVAASGTPVPTITKRTTLPSRPDAVGRRGHGDRHDLRHADRVVGHQDGDLAGHQLRGHRRRQRLDRHRQVGRGRERQHHEQASSVSRPARSAFPNQATCSGSGPDCSVRPRSRATSARARRHAELAARASSSSAGRRAGQVEAEPHGPSAAEKAGRIKGKLRITVTRGSAKPTKTIRGERRKAAANPGVRIHAWPVLGPPMRGERRPGGRASPPGGPRGRGPAAGPAGRSGRRAQLSCSRPRGELQVRPQWVPRRLKKGHRAAPGFRCRKPSSGSNVKVQCTGRTKPKGDPVYRYYYGIRQ